MTVGVVKTSDSGEIDFNEKQHCVSKQDFKFKSFNKILPVLIVFISFFSSSQGIFYLISSYLAVLMFVKLIKNLFFGVNKDF